MTQNTNQTARELREVTRTIKSTHCEVMCVDVNTAEVINESITLTGDYNEQQAFKIIVKKGLCNNTPVKVVHITTTEKLYGMSEKTFLENAVELPLRKAKED